MEKRLSRTDVCRFDFFCCYFCIVNDQNSFVAFCRRYLPKRDALLGQLWRYCITGGIAFVVDFGLFTLFLYGLDFHYLLANFFGLMGGLVVNYLISIGWVFTACERNFEQKKFFEFFLFSLIGFLGVGLNQLLMWGMVGLLEWSPMFSKIVAAVLVLMWNFGGRKLLLFRVKKETV